MNYSPNNTALFIATFIVIVLIIIDTSFIKVYTFLPLPINPIWNIIIFTTITATCFIGQYLILTYLKIKSVETGIFKQQLHLNIIHKAVTIVQCSIFTMLSIAVFQMLFFSSYSNVILLAVTAFSYLLAIAVIGLLTQRFFSWFRFSRNAVVISYGIAVGILTVNAAFTLAYVSNILVSQPVIIISHIGSVMSSALYDSPLYFGYFVSSILSFIMTWFATVLLLSHYSKKLGKLKYWIIVGIPLAYFLSQFEPIFLDIFSSYRQSNPVIFGLVYTLFYTLSKPIGGILFGVAFWAIARTISRDNVVRIFLTISAYGFVLLFASNQAIVIVNYPYPPFGLVTVSFMGISSYMLLVGIYSTAISVAHDIKLRQSVRKIATREFKLLDSIGTAHMEEEIEQKVLYTTSRNQEILKEQTGIESSLEEADIKQYLEEVLKEVKAKENKT